MDKKPKLPKSKIICIDLMDEGARVGSVRRKIISKKVFDDKGDWAVDVDSDLIKRVWWDPCNEAWFVNI